MTSKTALLFFWLAAILHGVHTAPEAVADDDKVERIFVIRRNLSGTLDGPPVDVGVLAHSGLLLKTMQGKYYTLEYMDDSKVHLTETTPETVKEHTEKKWAHIKAAGRSEGKEKVLEWSRQLSGVKIDPKYTPGELKTMMEEVVGEYSVWKKEYCHAAQERLRRKLGLSVD